MPKKLKTVGGRHYLCSGEAEPVEITNGAAYKFVCDKVQKDFAGKRVSNKKLREYADKHGFYGGWVESAYDVIKPSRSIESIERDIEKMEERSYKRTLASHAFGGNLPGGGALDRDMQRLWEGKEILKAELERAKQQPKAAAAPKPKQAAKPKHRKFEGIKRCKDIFEFMRLYLQELKAHGITDKVGAEKLFNKLRLERFVPVEMTRESAIATIRAGIREGVSVGWFRCEDKGMKPHLFNSIVKEDAVRSAGLNLMHELYNILNSSNISFDKFLHKEITLYRGGEVTSDIFTSFSLDKSMAKKFVKQSKTTEVTKIRVKPIQTLGSYQTIAEAEVLVPRTVLHTLKKQTKAATKPPRTPAPSVPAILTPAPAAASGMATVQIGLGGGIPPIPGMGAAAAPKPKPRAKKAATPKPKSKAKNGKTAAGITLTAAQKKRLAAKGSVTVKRDGKFVTITR